MKGVISINLCRYFILYERMINSALSSVIGKLSKAEHIIDSVERASRYELLSIRSFIRDTFPQLGKIIAENMHQL